MREKEFIKQRILENDKIFTEEEINHLIHNVDEILKIYKLGLLDAQL